MKLLILAVVFTLFQSGAIAQQAAGRTSEYTASSTILDLVGVEAARVFEKKIPVNEPVAWEVYVPADYDPDQPAGVLVFVNSRNSGKIEPEWKAVIDDNNLIWIGANASGNDIAIEQRVAYALLAPKLINNHYSINTERVYISGFSGGGRVASMVATEYNRIFKGAIYNSGANYWGETALPRYQEMTDKHYVFITGTEDFNLEDTRQVYDEYLKLGIRHSKLMVIPGMAHKRPAAQDLHTAIQYLDSRISGVSD
jgi:hypothetical protein